jgi:Cu/Ag efflux pump CusA
VRRRTIQQVLRSISTVRGAADAQMVVTSGVAELSVRTDRAALDPYGLNVSDVKESLASGASVDVVSKVIDGEKRFTTTAGNGRTSGDNDWMTSRSEVTHLLFNALAP